MARIPASSETASYRMSKVGQKDTKAELKLRRELFSRGLRYRLNIPLLKKPRRVADIVFIGCRVAVFVDGCFWHGCTLHRTSPKQNQTLWKEKIEANIARDNDTNTKLKDAGWEVVRIWEHDSVQEAADHIESVLAKRIKIRSK